MVRDSSGMWWRRVSALLLLSLAGGGGASGAEVDEWVARGQELRSRVGARYTALQGRLDLLGERYQARIDGSEAGLQAELRAQLQARLDAQRSGLQERGDAFRLRTVERIDALNVEIAALDPDRVVSTAGLEVTLTSRTLTADGGGGTGGTGLGGGAEGGRLLTEQHFYLLQADALGGRDEAIGAIAAVGADTFVLDAYFSGQGDADQYTAAELERIRSAGQVLGGSRSRVILAYLSIGEAEDYRPYWDARWDPDGDGKLARNPDGTLAAEVPGWLMDENPQWPGNYPVRYWDAQWQAVLFGSPAASLDRILAQGFDGVYLDIVDGFERFEEGEENKLNPVTGQSYRRDMVDFVVALASYARANKPGFLVVPQNGAQLLEFGDYLEVVSGQGQEDLYFDGNQAQPEEETAAVKARLDLLKAPGKAVLVTDYPTRASKRTEAFQRAAADGFSIFVAPRSLNGLGFLP